ncbi:MAG: DUF2232 domain-containing protein [Ruminococcaceae bacterium]|nr:DUF2232 domain-containing protein [Oscillospiraceae bacterium]
MNASNPSSNTALYDKPKNELFSANRTIIFTFLLIVSCSFIPCAVLSLSFPKPPIHFIVPAYVIIASGLAFLFGIIKQFKYTFSYVLIFFLLYSATSTPIIPAAFFAVMFIFTLGGYISSCCGKRSYALLILLPIVSYLGAYMLTGDWMFSLVSVIPYPAVIAQGVLHKKNSERTAIVATSTFLLLAFSVGFVALMLWRGGKLSYTEIKASVDGARVALSNHLQNLSVEVQGQAQPIFEAQYIDELITSTFNMLPGLIIMLSLVAVYLLHSLQIALYKRTELDIYVTAKNTKITMSIYAACIFILAYIFSLTTDTAGKPDLVSSVANNLYIIFVPGLFLVGLDGIGAMLKKLKGLGLFLILLLVIAIFMLSSFILLIVAAIGAFYIIIKSVDEWAKKHYSKPRG